MRKQITSRHTKALVVRDHALYSCLTPRLFTEDDIPLLDTTALTVPIVPSDPPPWMSIMEQ